MASPAVPDAERDDVSRSIGDLVLLLGDLGWSVTLVTQELITSTSSVRKLRQRGVAVVHGAPDAVNHLMAAGIFELGILGSADIARRYLPVIRRNSPSTRVFVFALDGRITDDSSDATGDEVARELEAYGAADAVLTRTRVEADTIAALVGTPGTTYVLPDSDDLSASPWRFADRRGIVHLGGPRVWPNPQASQDLDLAVFSLVPPDLLLEHPVFVLGGSPVAERLSAHVPPQLQIVTHVRSVLPHLARARVSVLPSGAGSHSRSAAPRLQDRVLRAIALGTPVVATSDVIRSLDLHHERELLIADEPEAFAHAISRLLTDESLWGTVVEHARAWSMRTRNRTAAREALVEALTSVFGRPPKGPVLPDPEAVLSWDLQASQAVMSDEAVPERGPVVPRRSVSGNRLGRAQAPYRIAKRAASVAIRATSKSPRLVPIRKLDPRRHLNEMRIRRDPRSLLGEYFDPDFYLQQDPELRRLGLDPLTHYLNVGMREGRAPNPFFHVEGYVFDNPDVVDYGGDPLVHYAVVGRRRRATPHPLFDAAWYARRYPDVGATGIDPYAHYLRHGRAEGRVPSAAVEQGVEPTALRIGSVPMADATVTIIVPAYRNFADTYRCLASVATHTPRDLGIRVILADDDPERQVGRLFADVDGLEIIFNRENLGFLRNCNEASKSATGDYVVFLNNDTVVTRGWLDSLLDLARRDPMIGMVGSKLLDPDGSLQSAGVVMYDDAEGDPYGLGDRASKPEYGYVRQVDCVMGACFLVRRDLFESVGRFDEEFQPAFFEEYDLAFAVGHAGYKVVYQPESVVYHYGSGSYSLEIRHRQTAINRRRFAVKWTEELSAQPRRAEGLFLARERPHAGGTILVIDDRVPAYDKHAGAVFIWQLLRLLVEHDLKVVFKPHHPQPVQPYTSALQQLGIEVLHGDVDMDRWLMENGRHVDWVFATRPDVAAGYLASARRWTRARLVYYTMDLHFVREHRRYEVTGDRRVLAESDRLRALEMGIFDIVDCVATPSYDEATLIAALVPGKDVRILAPYVERPEPGVASESARLLADRTDVIFVGGFQHLPNVDAAILLVREIMPLVWREVPGARVLIVGDAPPAKVQGLASDRVTVTGFVPDLDPFYARARMSVSPLRFGAGVKGKILSSLQAGVPVITTTIGNEGIGLAPGVEALIADQPGDIAAQIVRLFVDTDLLESLAVAGRRGALDRFSKVKTRQQLFDVLGLDSCPVCGTRSRAARRWRTRWSDDWADAVACDHCHARNRTRALAEVVIEPYRRFACPSIAEARHYLSALRIRYDGIEGAINRQLASLPGSKSDDAAYDLIISEDVVYAGRDGAAQLADIHRILKPGGRFVLTAPLDALGSHFLSTLEASGFTAELRETRPQAIPDAYVAVFEAVRI